MDVDPGRYRTGINLRGQYDPYPVLYAPGTEEPKLSKSLEVSEEEPDGVADFWLPEPKRRRFEIQVFWPDGQQAKGAQVSLIYGRWPTTRELRADESGLIAVEAYAMLGYRLYAHANRSAAEPELASVPVIINRGGERIWLPLVLGVASPEEIQLGAAH